MSHSINVTIDQTPNYNGLPISMCHGPLVKEYLDTAENVIKEGLLECSEISAVLVDLILAREMEPTNDQLMTEFIYTFQSMIDNEMEFYHDKVLRCRTRYLWSRNCSDEGKTVSYSLMIILNKKAYDLQDSTDSWRVLFGIKSAWAIASGFDVSGGIIDNPYVEPFKNSIYVVNKADSFPYYNKHEFNNLYLEASQLCSLQYKNYASLIPPFTNR